MAKEKNIEDHGVLTAQGTNEFEMLSFRIDDKLYGVNVSKVREILSYEKITPLPGEDERILGCFMPRDEIVTAIDLKYCLGGVHSTVPKENERKFLIVCHFNNTSCAFQVDQVVDIKRFSWKDIISPKDLVADETTSITGLVKREDLNNDICSVLDFEQIVASIAPTKGLNESVVETISENEKQIFDDVTVLCADDSRFLLKTITEAIRKTGMQVIACSDGLNAYETLKSYKKEGTLDKIDVIISDIEMPNKDGMSLCKDCKEDPELKEIPFLLFSSLADKSMVAKGKSIGADGVFSKPELEEVIKEIKVQIMKKKGNK